MCLREQGRRAGRWKLGEEELTQLNCQYLLKFPYVVRKRNEQHIVTKRFIILVSFHGNKT